MGWYVVVLDEGGRLISIWRASMDHFLLVCLFVA